MLLPRFVFPLACAAFIATPLHSSAQAVPTPPRDFRVMLVGNSLTYTNNLPALLRAVGASQGSTITTETFAAPGGRLAERWNDGHAAEGLKDGHVDVVVLQEIGSLPACLASASQQRKAPCAASLHAHREFARVAAANGVKVLLFTTWANDPRVQGRIDRGMRTIAGATKASIFNAAGAIEALRKTQPEVRAYPDGVHPSTQTSLMLALALYRAVTGTTPKARELRINAPLLPVTAAVSGDSAMEGQPNLVGDGNVTVVPASLIQPLINALPAEDSGEVRPPYRGR